MDANVKPPEEYRHAEAFCLMTYLCKGCGHREVIWNSRDGVTPFAATCPSCGGATLASVTAKARHGFVMPITHAGDDARCHPLDEPLPTLTTAHRGELAFITASFGERDGQMPRFHPLDEPMPTILAEGHSQLVEPGPRYDILYRMLEPHELARAHSFNDGDDFEFAGTKTDMNRQIGNSNPTKGMTALVEASFYD